MPRNTGGAGGFARAMKVASATNFDRIWLMDDDGYPASDCLENLLAKCEALDVAGSAVVQAVDNNSLTWGLRRRRADGRLALRTEIRTLQELGNLAEGGIYVGDQNFFNSTFFRREVLASLGPVDEALVIGGDEQEYFHRCRSRGYRVGTIVDSLYFHPRPTRPTTPERLFYWYRNGLFNFGRYGKDDYPGWARPIYPWYLTLKYLRRSPSYDPRFISRLLVAGLRALKGTLEPYER